MKFIGDYLNREVYHYWIEDNNLSHVEHVNDMKRINPSYVFDMTIPQYQDKDIDVCYSEWLPGDFWHQQQCTGQYYLNCKFIKKLNSLEEIKKDNSETILIETSNPLFPSNLEDSIELILSKGYENLKLNNKWKNIYFNLAKYDFGVAIRRGNFLHYHPEANKSLDEIYSKLQSYSGSKIIFSDDIDFRNQLRDKLFCYNDVGLSGLDNYLLQFFTLSKCKNIISTLNSSFGKQASLYGSNNYIGI